jgi:putative chitinase
MVITARLLLALAPFANKNLADGLAPAMNKWLPIYGMTQKLIVQHFLAQAAEETDGFKTLKEYASGKAYEGRKDLGNIHPGDGVKYAGEGIFMQTGLENYSIEAKELGLDLVHHPELLQIADNAVHAACQYWQDRKITPLALANDIKAVTHKVNGGVNGLATRELYLRRAVLLITSDLDTNKATETAPTASSLPSGITASPASGAVPAPQKTAPILPSHISVADHVIRGSIWAAIMKWLRHNYITA